jgi:hypothetical protein
MLNFKVLQYLFFIYFLFPPLPSHEFFQKKKRKKRKQTTTAADGRKRKRNKWGGPACGGQTVYAEHFCCGPVRCRIILAAFLSVFFLETFLTQLHPYDLIYDPKPAISSQILPLKPANAIFFKW